MRNHSIVITVAAAILAITGFGWMVWLLGTGPTLEYTSDSTANCFSSLTTPDTGRQMDRTTDVYAELEQEDAPVAVTDGDLAYHVDVCSRLRGRRVALAVLAAPPVAVLGTIAAVGAIDRNFAGKLLDKVIAGGG
jgi:hypothetical protein